MASNLPPSTAYWLKVVFIFLKEAVEPLLVLPVLYIDMAKHHL
jgi:hypothetical protein